MLSSQPYSFEISGRQILLPSFLNSTTKNWYRLSKERKFTKLDTDSVVGKVNAAKMVRRSAETKKEGVTSEEPADGYGRENTWDLEKVFVGWCYECVFGFWYDSSIEVMYIESPQYLHVARCRQ